MPGKTSFSYSKTTPTNYHSYDSLNGVVVNDYGFSSSYAQSESRRRTSVNTPNWRTLRKAGSKHLLPFNPFDYYERAINPPYGISWTLGADRIHRIKEGFVNEGFATETLGIDAQTRDRINDAALVGILQNLKEQKVNLGVIWAERARTATLVWDTAQRLARSVTHFRHGNITGGLRELGYQSGVGRVGKTRRESLANDVLAVQYGVRPLVSDVYHAAEYLASLKAGGMRFNATTTRTHAWVRNSEMEPGKWNYVPIRSRDVGKYSVKYVVHFTYSLEHVHTLSSGGITNPASWLWEILPWSFVFDWFLKIGEWIDLFDATAGLQFVGGSKTVFEKWDVNQKAAGTVQNASTLHFVNLRSGSRLISCTRTPLSSFPTLVLPRLGTGLSGERIGNALALLTQRLSKRSTK